MNTGNRKGFMPRRTKALRSAITLLILCAIGTSLANGQNPHDWQSLAQLNIGDLIHLSLKSGPVEDAAFQSWTPQDVTVGAVTAKREDVIKIERYRKGGRGGRR